MDIMQLVINLGSIIIGLLVIYGYIKKGEKTSVEEMAAQKTIDEMQNQKLALLEQRLTIVESNTKEIKSEIIEKVDRVNSKVDDLKYMLIEFLAKNK